MRKKYEEIIAIDPDNEKSGVASVDTRNGEVKVYKMTFPELINFIKSRWSNAAKPEGKIFNVVIEAGWLNQGNWHLGLNKYMSASRAAAIGRSVGLNHQTGILLQQVCEDMMIPTELQRPYRKTWKGKDGKITQKEIEQLTGHPKLPRMNQDQRDALLIAWVHSGLPMKTQRMTLEEYRKTFK